ncbi:hypothetical protein FXO37_35633 [Capsicum annuum]|nr:hypothetical protein FXO37_35633 [Capsicum annuum]
MKKKKKKWEKESIRLLGLQYRDEKAKIDVTICVVNEDISVVVRGLYLGGATRIIRFAVIEVSENSLPGLITYLSLKTVSWRATRILGFTAMVVSKNSLSELITYLSLKSGRGGVGRGYGRGSFLEHLSSDTISQPQIQPIGVVGTSLETGQLCNPSEGPLQTQQMQTGPIQRTFPETQSSRNLDKSVRLSVEAETGPASHINKKKERGKYKSKTMDFKFKHGGKIKIMIPDDIDIAVGSGARDIVNYCGWIMKTTVSFRDGSRQQIVLKHGEAMWYRFKGKFEVRNGLLDHKLQGFVRNPLTGEKDTPDKIWEIQHTCKNVNGERVWLDPQSEQIHGQLQQLVVEQQSEKIELCMIGDEILSSILGERSGYIQGKGHSNKPPEKN